MNIKELTPLHIAAQAGNLDKVKTILEKDDSDINDQNNHDEETPLSIAVKNKQWAVAELLVKNKADISCFDKNYDDVIRLSLFVNINLVQAKYFIDKCFVNEARLNRLLKIGILNYSEDNSIVSKIVFQITGNLIVKDWAKNTNLCRDYQMYLGNILEWKIEHQGRINIQGNYANDILAIRLSIYIELYLKLANGSQRKLPNDENGNKYNVNATLEKLHQEIKILCNTLINERLLGYLTNLGLENPQLAKELIKVRAEGIMKELNNLSSGEEYVIRSGYEGNPGHCLYVSLCKIDDKRVIVRVDNRWIKLGRIDGITHNTVCIMGANNIKQIKSYCIGIFILSKDGTILSNYIKGVLQAVAESALGVQAALTNIYGINLPSQIKTIPNELRNYINNWPLHNIQTDDNGNCTLSSNNMGISVRCGLNLFNWLLKNELNALPLAAINSTIPLNRNTKVQAGGINISPSISEERQPQKLWQERVEVKILRGTESFSHTELMKKLQQELKVAWDEVYSGTVVEQTLANMAGINTEQSGAMFRSKGAAETVFSLKFSSLAEYNKFINYYNEKFPNLIKERGVYNAEGLTQVVMDTKILYNEVAPALGKYISSLTISTRANKIQPKEQESCLIM